MNRQLAGLALFLFLGISGCNARGKSEGQVVAVSCCRDMNAPFQPWFFEVSSEFGSRQPRTKSGKPILITTYEMSDFVKGLSDKGQDCTRDLIIGSSPSQIPQNLEISKELKNAKNICPSRSPCLAFIPPWVQGDQHDATNFYVDFLLAHR
jgi:hypothetical protein